MDFIDVVREKASEIAIGAVKTSNAVVTHVKTNFAIADKEMDVKKIYNELGIIMYKAYKDGVEPNADEVAEKCVILDELNGEINELKEKLREAKNMKACPKCNASVKEGHNFCPLCGAEMN